MQKVAAGADPCPYFPRMKALLRQLSGEMPDLAESMAPIVSQLENTDDGCSSKPVSTAPAKPTAPAARRVPPPETLTIRQQLDERRKSLGGINRLMLPAGEVSPSASGAYSLSASGQREFTISRTGAVASIRIPQGFARFHSDGRVSSIKLSNVSVWQSPRGERTSIVQKSDGTSIVTAGPQTGYVEKLVRRNNRDYVVRDYLLSGGHRTIRVYAATSVAGKELPVYIPKAAYSPKFYGWLDTSWTSSTPYSWPWLTDQLFQNLSAYFTPDGNYANPIQWLVDFALSKALTSTGSSMQASQDTSITDESVEASSDTPVSPESKQDLATDIRQYLQDQRAGTSAGLGKLFVVSIGRESAMQEGTQCWLSVGDVLRLADTLDGSDDRATVTLASSRQADCPAGTRLRIPVRDLNEMRNDMRAAIDDGLQILATSKNDSWPPAPAGSIAPPPQVVTTLATESNFDVSSLLQTALEQSATAENEFVRTAFAPQ